MVQSVEAGGSRGRGRPRGRPRAAAGGSLLSREVIVQKALVLAGEEGFGALSMHRLAEECGVTPRALYNHVANRQDVIDAVAGLMLRMVPQSELDPGDWRTSLHRAYAEAREVYRRFPRATLISLDETVSAARVDPRRIELAEQMLQFFCDIGLSLEQAITVRDGFLFDVFGFVLLVDYSYDRSPEAVRQALAQPVPQVWLDENPQSEAPLSRAAAQRPSPTSDQRFEDLVNLRVAGIERLLSQS